VYQLPAYVELEARRTGGQPAAALARADGMFVLVPLVLRPLPAALGVAGARDAASPYGYPGLIVGGGEAGPLSALLNGLLTGLAGVGVCSLFVRLHTLLGQAVGELSELGRVVRHGETVWIDLTLTDEQLWRQTRENHRRKIRKLIDAGVTVRIEEGWRRLGDFIAIYHDAMRAVGAAEWYFFDRSYFEALHAALGEHVYLALVERSEELIAGGIFTLCGDLMQYHLGATAGAARPLSPSCLMFHYMRTWGRDHGAGAFNLGGGVGASADSLFHFKAGFTPLRAPFFTWRAISDPGLFGAAMGRWEVLSGRTAGGLDGYFPAYREAIAEAAMSP
jgi:hypothetical protein